MTFTELGLNESLLEALGYMNFEKATPIQEQAIPVLLQGGDIIGCAQTGTGKTAAFVLPILHKLTSGISQRGKGINTLILCPTRELAVQIEQQIQGLAYFSDVTSYAIFGGGTGPEWDAEQKALKNGTDIIIATPGRLIAHLRNGYANWEHLEHLILDEADRMLDIGFYDDIKRIIKELPVKRQSLMFSATMAPRIRKLAQEILSEPTEINLAVSKPAAGVTQEIYLAFEEQKRRLAQNIIGRYPDFKSILIFCATKKKVQQTVRAFQAKNLNVRGMSSDYEQRERQDILLSFKSRQTRILVATDVMSRGIDIKDIDLVINFDVPGDPEDYVHRVGRTARAASKGLAITFVAPEDMYKFRRIEEFIEHKFEKLPPPAEIGDGPEWEENRKKSSFGRGGARHSTRSSSGGGQKGGASRSSGGGQNRKKRPYRGGPKGSKPNPSSNSES